MGRKKKQEDDTDKVSLIGRRVEKDFQGFGKFGGSVVAFNAARGFYKVVYDDGDREELESGEVETILVDGDDGGLLSKKRERHTKQREELRASSEDVPDSKRRKQEPASKENTPSIRSNDPEDSARITRHRPSRQRLKEENLPSAEVVKENKADEESVLKGQNSSVQTSKRKRQDEECGSGPSSVRATGASSRKTRSQNLLQAFDDEASTPGRDDSSDDGAQSDVDEEDESSSFDENDLSMVHANEPEEVNLPALIPLPPSSKTIPLPDDLVVEALAVYSFLRSFSHALFLCPFCLDDFVNAVNANTPNHLIDSIHLILLQALRRHLQRLLKEDCVKSKECLRQRDWNLLDNVTWPSFLMVFLYTHGFGKSYGQPISLLGLLDDEYYKVSVKVKLAVLGFLCDHVLETEEIRAVLDARELESASQIRERDMRCLGGKGIGVGTRQSFVAKDHDGKAAADVMEREKVADEAVQGANPSLIGPIHTESKEKNITDWNSDECVLCGMNGNLICCDGCPAAYHSRCVGISRSSLPPGDWFCPECIVDKVGGEQSRRMRGLGGCISLGVDPYGRSFMATCGHLLVLNPRDSMQFIYSYYTKKDITGVLQNLESMKPLCNEVAIAICEHWDVPAKHLFLSNSSQQASETLPISSEGRSNSETACREVKDQELDAPLHQVLISDDNERSLDSESSMAQVLDCVDLKESLVVSVVAEQPVGQPIVEGYTSVDAPLQMAATDSNPTLSSRDIPVVECDSKVAEQALEFMPTRPLEAALFNAPDVFTSKRLGRAVADTAHITPNSQCLEQDPYLAQNISDRDTKGRFLTASQREQLPAEQAQKPAPWEYLHTDSVQRLTSYINHYIFGDAAATAAANFTLMTADQLISPEKAKKKTTTIAEQLNAFCKAPARFCWPSFRRKLMDGPKDRCGWCFTCTSNMKRGCLMNQAAAQLAAGAARVTGGIRPGKSGSGHLPAVAGYLLHMEESWHGLLAGPWTNIMFRKQWRRRLEQTSSLLDVKASLLDLEAHIRSVALTEDWSKCMEDAPDMVLGGSNLSSLDDSISKKTSGKKLSRRSVGVSRRALPKTSSTALGTVQWARRGKIAHRVSGWATLSSKVARKAGRQGGSKKISGISYVDGEEVPKRNQETVWRARVQAAQTIAELAVQVRCLDSVLRWEDLVSKVEVQSIPNVSGSNDNAEITEFGVHAKSVKENVHSYLIDSILVQTQGTRQNLSAASRLQNCKNQQVWVDERQVPLFLLKDFEEKERASKQSEAPKLITLQKHHLEPRKILKKDVFKFLWERAGFSIPTKLVVSVTCKFCSLKVSASLAVQCHLCREPFHKECTVASHSVGKLELKYTCCGCLKVAVGQKHTDSQKIKEELIPHLGMQKNENAQPTLNLPNKPKKIVLTQSRPPQLTSPVMKLSVKPPWSATTYLKAPLSATTSRSLVKPEVERESSEVLNRSSVSVPKSSEKSNYEGVTWRKHGRASRMRFERNMLYPVEGSGQCHEVPKCYACNQQFQGDLVYIRCEYCPVWFHGAALGVNQSNAREVLSFKCHKCRKKGVPSCPFGTNHRMHKRVVESSKVGDVYVTKRTPLPLLRSDENQRQKFVASTLPNSRPAISSECATVRQSVESQLLPSLDTLQQRVIQGKPLVDTKLITQVSMDTFQARPQGSNTCFAKRTPFGLSRVFEKQTQQHVSLPVSDSTPAIPLDCAVEKPSEGTQLLSLNPASEELKYAEGSSPVKPLVGNEPLVNGPVWQSMVEVPQCAQGLKGESEQVEDAQNGSDLATQEDGQYLPEGEEALSMEILDGGPKIGEASTQPTLSFMELLSSEDDRVEELAEVAMDFNDDVFDIFDLDMLVDSFGCCGTSAASLEPEALSKGDPSQYLDQSVIQSMGLIADAADDMCAVCCDGSLPSDLQCFGCGVAVHQGCVAGQSATETWSSNGWACDACKAEVSQSLGEEANFLQMV